MNKFVRKDNLKVNLDLILDVSSKTYIPLVAHSTGFMKWNLEM